MIPATPAVHTPLDLAYTRFLLAVGDNRPRELRALNSPGALERRACDIDAQMIACKDWLKALVEDTAANINLPRRIEDVVEAHMTDLAGDIRGAINVALCEAMESAT